MKNKTHMVVPREPINGALWSRTVEVQSIQDLEALLPPRSQVPAEDLTESIRFKVSVEPLLREFYESSRVMKAE